MRRYALVLVWTKGRVLIPSDKYKVFLADFTKWAMVKVNTMFILGEDTGKFLEKFCLDGIDYP